MSDILRRTQAKAGHDESLDLSDVRARELLAKEMAVAARVLEVLDREWPGHRWGVKVDAKGINKAVLIKIPALMRAHDHYVLPLMDLLGRTINGFERRVKDAGGELLERFRIPRSGFTESPFLIAREARLRNPMAKVPI